MSIRKYRQQRRQFNENLALIDEYSPRFSEWQTPINLLTALTAILFCLGLRTMLLACSRFLASRDHTAIFQFPFTTVIWWFFPVLATTISFELLLQIWSLLGSRRIANAYSQWAALQPKSYRSRTTYMDSRAVFNKFFLFLAMPVGILTILALNMHVIFTQHEFISCGYAFQPCSVHPYTSIRALYTVDGRWSNKHSSFIPSPDIVIDFDDKSRWSEYQWTESSRKGFDSNLLRFLVEETGIQPQAIHIAEDLPQP